jgi:hypothetical protein
MTQFVEHSEYPSVCQYAEFNNLLMSLISVLAVLVFLVFNVYVYRRQQQEWNDFKCWLNRFR